MSIELAILGPVIITLDGRAVSLPAKAQALLGYLAVQRAPQRREQVLALLWPESSADAARKNGRNSLWAIRKALGSEAVQTYDEMIALDSSITVDMWRWEAGLLEDPLGVAGLYRGPLLDGLHFDDAPELDLWLTLERERLAQTAIRILSVQAQRALAEQRWCDVVPLVDQALQIDPLQEPLYRVLIEALAQQGERSEALRRYALLETVLSYELGVEPLPETQTLRDQILQGTLLPAAPALVPPPPPEPVAHPQTPFVGRQELLNQLDQAFAELQAPTVMLISGEIGIGKTRLWKEWMERQDPAPRRLLLQGLKSIQSLPFASLIDMFSSPMCMSKLFMTPSRIAPVWLAELTRLLPEGRALLPSLPPPAPLPADEERRRIFEAFLQLLLAHEPPLVLVADDIHWLDSATLNWLDYAVQRLAERPILVIVTYRAEEATPQLQDILGGWKRHGVVQRVHVPHLDVDEATVLLHELGVDDPRVAAVAQQSGGNPLFLVEWSRTPAEALPPQLSDVISVRLERLPAAAQQLLQAAAVLHPNFSLDTLRRTSGRTEEEVIDGIDALLAAGILAEDGDRYAFVHPLIAATVEASMSNARRRFLHRRAAQIRELSLGSRPGSLSGQLMRHYRMADEPHAAAHYADLAAEHAQSVGATNEALAFREAALELEPTAERRRALGTVHMWLGEITTAQTDYQAALGEFEASGAMAEAVRTCLMLAESHLPQARGELAVAWAERALHTLNGQRDPELLANIHFTLGVALRFAGHPLEDAEEHLRLAGDLARTYRLPWLIARSDFELGNVLTQRGELDSAIEYLQNSIALAQQVQDHFQEVLGHNNLAFVALQAQRLELARQHIQQAFDLVETWAMRVPQQYLFSTRGELALAEEQWDAAQAWFERGRALAEHYANALQIANYDANLGLVERGRGDFESALHLFQQAQEQASALAAPFLQTQIDLWIAETGQTMGLQALTEQALAQARQRLATSEHGLLGRWLQRLEPQVPEVS